MNDFSFYFGIGWHHIISWNALDHILFIIALVAIYLIPNWKQVLILVTAFTIGHSFTLALSVLDIIRFNEKWVEFLIPCTILVTGAFNLRVKALQSASLKLNYFAALIFGFIHGMGFANTIRFILAGDQHITIPLLGFNLGLEAGQVLLVTIILFISYIVVTKAGLNRKWWIWALSSVAILTALVMALNRLPMIK